MAKKSFNAFKMWGSYVGAFILGIFIIFPILAITINSEWSDALAGLRIESISLFQSVASEYFENPFMLLAFNPLVFSISFLGSLILGFSLGWGIHSLIRRFRK